MCHALLDDFCICKGHTQGAEVGEGHQVFGDAYCDVGLQGGSCEEFDHWVVILVATWFLDGQAMDLALNKDVGEDTEVIYGGGVPCCHLDGGLGGSKGVR